MIMESYVYIKQNIAKHFIDFAEPLKEEEYNNIGTTWEDYRANKWVLLDGRQKEFLENHPTASVKEVWEMEMSQPSQNQLARAKRELERRIDQYDKSNNVNGFTVNNTIEGWFTPEERSDYRSSIDAAKTLNIETLSFYVGDIPLTVTTQQADYMLAQIQLYANACFMVTKQHKIAVRGLATIEEVNAYDYTQGYPEKLNFDVSWTEEEAS